MQRKHRHLDGEGHEKREGGPGERSRGKAKLPGGEHRLELREIEGAGFGVEVQDRDQKECRRDKRVEEKLDRGGRPLGAPEHGDQDRHGNQRQLPETVVQDQVERDKDAQHRGLLQQEEEVKLLGARRDGGPAGQHTERREEACEHDQPQRDAVHTQVVVDVGVLNPEIVFDELERAGAVVVVKRQVKRERKGQQREREGRPRDQLAGARQQRDHQRAQRRDKGEDREDVIVQHGGSFLIESCRRAAGCGLRSRRK